MAALAKLSRIPTSYAVLLLLVASSILFTFHAVSLTSGFVTIVPANIKSSRDGASIIDSSKSAAVSGAVPPPISDSGRSSHAAAPSGHSASESKISGAESVSVKAQSEPSLSQRFKDVFTSSSSGHPSEQQIIAHSSCSVPSTSSLRAISPSSPESPPLLPWPSQVMIGNQGEGPACGAAGSCCGPFTVGEATPIFVVSPQSKGAASIKAVVQRAAVTISALANRDAVLLPRITVCIIQPEESPNAGVSEEYSLRVSGDGIHIICDNKVGLAWALSTLHQLLQDYAKMCVVFITDKPRLSHRGVLLDVARNFVPVSDINLLLNTMSAVKLNVLHMHLTDDQVASTAPILLFFFTLFHTTSGLRIRQCFLSRVHVI
jgi:hypothetical protein